MMDPVAAALPPGRWVDPGQRLTFSFEGRQISAFAGQSVAAALYAAGVRIFTRSFKYHRPRGLLCVAGDCPNCLMQVDGRPNVRTCIEPARDGQVVCHQNAWPSLDFDLLRVFDYVDRLLPVGFYYRHFHKPRWLWPVFEHVLRHVAGLGSINTETGRAPDGALEHWHKDVCVIGGGPAGLAAAEEAAAAGASVLLIERQPRLGGHLQCRVDKSQEVETRIESLTKRRNAHVLCDTTAFGLYEGNLIGAFADNRLLKIRAKQIIACTGGRERPFVFQNNELPGIMLARGIQRLARLYGVKAGHRAVVLSDRDDASAVAEDLVSMGIEVAAVVDPRVGHAGKSAPWPNLTGHAILRASGRSHLKAVDVAPVREDGTLDTHGRRRIDCDLLCMASRLVPANELYLQGRHDRGVTGAGSAAGQGVGWAESSRPTDPSQDQPTSMPAWGSGDRKRFVCLCEDVTEKDLHQAVAEGFDHIETLKRYSTATMGPCQGKMCGQALREICARATGRGLDVVGATTSRPSAVPVEMAVLAAGRFHPVRRTPLHHWHAANGAIWLDAGWWKRPESYGDPMAEARAVRQGVGLIDASTLGKIEVIGPNAAELLDRVYLNRWRDLAVGRARYGVMCTEEGILFDDGVGGRLTKNRFYVTATTGNAEAVVQWLQLWSATWRLDVLVLDRTAAVAAMNLAGPLSRQVLRPLTTIDLSTAAFPYMALREGAVAGVPCRLFRIGFVGELGYEIHCSSADAWHLWTALCEAGAEAGLRPFGVEAQRILRLEKGHLIMGQDTDALSTPLEAGLEWLVGFEKPLFHGRGPLLKLKALGARSRLVGFCMKDPILVPAEGSQIVDDGRPVGRISSARYSPALERSLGLAWVPPDKAAVGQSLSVRWNGSDVAAEVAALPFYDPAGKRLKA
jgi:sarcosine oxidase subunit alpha